MRKHDTIIFDLDGTLLNTLEDLQGSVNYALDLYCYPARDIEEIREFIGNGVGRLMELSIPGGYENPHFADCLKQFRTHYSNNMLNKTRPYDDVILLLEQLTQMDYKMGIVSNKFDSAVKDLNNLFFANYIGVAIGESEGVLRKPAPDTIFKALNELNSTPERSLYVGDSDVDIETAHNAGLKIIGVTWGFRDRALLEQKGADYIIDKPQELLSILNKMD